MQLSLDAADRLVELVEHMRSPVPAEAAARELFALRSGSHGLARTLLDDVVATDARLRWSGSSVALAPHAGAEWPLDAATYVVVDLETTGLSPGRSRICEIGAVRLRGLVPAGTFETLADPGTPLPPAVASLTGLANSELRTAPTPQEAVRRFLAFAGQCVLVAHNARFDLGFLDREVERLTGSRLAAPVVDTVWLARNLLAGRAERASLAALAHFFGTAAVPCHRALPDARATAEILVALVGLAEERGAATVDDLCRLSAPRSRRTLHKRSLVAGAPARPGVYLFRGRSDEVLYVGRARDLRARLRSYFASRRQRPAVEAALGAAERIEWRIRGSELEAALEEGRLIRELRPPANVRGARPDRYLYLERRGSVLRATSNPTALGPLRGRRRVDLAVRALAGAEPEELDRLSAGGPLPRLRARLRALAESLRYEEAAKLRDRIVALEGVVRDLARLERLRSLELCLVVPALEVGFRRAVVVAGGRVASTRLVPPGAGATLELEAMLAEASVPAETTPADADDLLLVGAFLRRPPPELTVVSLADRRALARAFGLLPSDVVGSS